jgi:hypothetical protein
MISIAGRRDFQMENVQAESKAKKCDHQHNLLLLAKIITTVISVTSRAAGRVYTEGEALGESHVHH